jgi:hypothetical protein
MDAHIYDGLEPGDAFGLALHLASGGTLGVPADYNPDSPGSVDPTPDPDAPRRPQPDMSQGRGSAAPTDPAATFGHRLLDAIDRPYPARWRDL